MKSDTDVMALLDKAAVSYQLVLTKADKLKPAQLAEVTRTVLESSLRHGAAHPEIIATSSVTGHGIPELRAALTALTRQ